MKKRRILSLLIAIFVLLGPITPAPQAVAAPLVPITAPTAILLDAQSNKVIYAKTPHLKRRPASTTKVLTAIVVAERLSLGTTVRVPKSATTVQPSKIYLKTGERYYVRDLLSALLLKSANDVAETLAVAVAGSRTQFAKLMNQKARQIGAKDSRFVNPHGLPAEGQYSTVYDMALIMREAQKYPFIVETMKRRSMSIRSATGRKINLRNHNKMLWRDSREVLGKTGWTRRAKHCFVGRIRVSGKKVFVAVLGSHSLWRDLKRLIDFRFGSISRAVKANQKLWATRSKTKQVQLALKRAGYSPGSVDGVWGSRTISAVKKFQKTKGLSVDGIVGKKTWSHLKRYLK